MATGRQVYYAQGLIGKALVLDKVIDKKDLWDKLDLLETTKLEELDNKEMSAVIKKLDELIK